MTQMQTDDLIDPARVAALNATLGRHADDLPLFGHQAFFWTAMPPENLGRDGHPAVGHGLIPDLGLARRMWAGGEITWINPLQTGPATRHSNLLSSEIKQGKRGLVGVVKLLHEITQNGQLCVTDTQNLVYLEDKPFQPGSAPEAPTGETHSETRTFTTTELFRYSALTFNGHRIHYDRDYAAEVEGYPGLVVHGPLLAQYLILMAERLLGGLRTFTFRATAPLFDYEEATFCARETETGLALWVRGPDGRQNITASAQ